MEGYWVRHRLLPALIMGAAVAIIAGMLFVFPSIMRRANDYNSQSIYRNTDIDFIAPEPSFDQIEELSGLNGIDEVFPFYLTKTQVNAGGTSRQTTVLLSDQFENIDITMYNSNRLIKKSGEEFDNSILVDWQFCKDTSADIGDTVSIAVGGSNVEFRIYAIYETNSIYDSGAILAQINTDLKESIRNSSKNNGYSGIYISASDYNKCRTYLTTEYRPLGRLKTRDQFENDEQYQLHYDAIMSSGYANEITDFRIRENELKTDSSYLLMILGTILTMVIMIAFNAAMSKRGCEKVYFTKQCIPRGKNVKQYYKISFFFEVIVFIVFYATTLIAEIGLANEYIPKEMLGTGLLVVPMAAIIAECISLAMNYSMVTIITKK